jgi:hypothetical protein
MRDTIDIRFGRLCGWTVAVLLCSAATSMRQTTPANDADLAKELANPLASLVAVPLQFNWDSRSGPTRTRVSR